MQFGSSTLELAYPAVGPASEVVRQDANRREPVADHVTISALIPELHTVSMVGDKYVCTLSWMPQV